MVFLSYLNFFIFFQCMITRIFKHAKEGNKVLKINMQCTYLARGPSPSSLIAHGPGWYPWNLQNASYYSCYCCIRASNMSHRWFCYSCHWVVDCINVLRVFCISPVCTCSCPKHVLRASSSWFLHGWTGGGWSHASESASGHASLLICGGGWFHPGASSAPGIT